MSMLSVIKAKLGISGTTSNNFIFDASAADGTLKLQRESGQDVLTVDENGVVSMPQNPNTQLGVGQTWQNMLSSRVSGTTYTNDTDKPICVCVSSNNTTGSLTFRVNGLIVVLASTTSSYGSTGQTTVIVPAGNTYSVTMSSGSLTHWVELR